MTTSIDEIKGKVAGPAGTTPAADQPETGRRAFKCRLVPFMLEDYVDGLLAKQALNDPENGERISWEKLKEDLGV
jgi:hypothetical protein